MSLDNDIKRILRETLVLGGEVESLEATSPLLGAIPELDSVGVISVLTALEEEYDIVVEDDEISAAVFNTLGTLTEFLEGKVSVRLQDRFGRGRKIQAEDRSGGIAFDVDESLMIPHGVPHNGQTSPVPLRPSTLRE